MLKRISFHRSGEGINFGQVRILYDNKLKNSKIIRNSNIPLYFVNTKNLDNPDLVVNDGKIRVKNIDMNGIFNIRKSDKRNALLFCNKENKCKMVIREKGVSISDDNINEDANNAVLLLQSKDSGLLLPRIEADTIRSNMGTAVPGTIIYDKTNDSFLGKTKKGWTRLDNRGPLIAPHFSEEDKTNGKVVPRPGSIIYNTTLHCFQGYSNKRWINIL